MFCAPTSAVCHQSALLVHAFAPLALALKSTGGAYATRHRRRYTFFLPHAQTAGLTNCSLRMCHTLANLACRHRQNSTRFFLLLCLHQLLLCFAHANNNQRIVEKLFQQTTTTTTTSNTTTTSFTTYTRQETTLVQHLSHYLYPLQMRL